MDANGIITWTPTEAQGPGDYLITTVVIDNGVPQLSTANSFMVHVNELNNAPVLPFQANRSSVGIATVTVTNTATDTDLPASSMAYTLFTGPTNATIGAGGVITWTPIPAQVPSTNIITTVATDTNPGAVNAINLSATNSFIITINLDARSAANLQYDYTTLIDLPEAAMKSPSVQSRLRDDAVLYEPPPFDDPRGGDEPLAERPIVTGSGPAGLLPGYYLALKGYRPIILERGRPVKERVPAVRAFDRGGALDREDNYLFGEGGAGCFSDGKLTCRLEGPDVEWSLQAFVDCGAVQCGSCTPGMVSRRRLILSISLGRFLYQALKNPSSNLAWRFGEY